MICDGVVHDGCSCGVFDFPHLRLYCISALDVRVAGGMLDVVREQQLFDFATEARIVIREDDFWPENYVHPVTLVDLARKHGAAHFC